MPGSQLDLSGLTLPPLPDIQSNEVRDQAFTHRSLYGRPGHLFEDPPDDPSPDNEKLEHIGDSIISLVVTMLLNDMYPRLKVGPATKARAMIVGNATLANISTAYKLHEQLRLHPSQKLILKQSVNVRADLFESFVGGLEKDQGLNAVQSWLRELFRPLCHQAYEKVKEYHGLSSTSSPSISPSEEQIDTLVRSPLSPARLPRGFPTDPTQAVTAETSGHLALFNQSIQKEGRTVEWTFPPLGPDGNPSGSDDGSSSSGSNTSGSISPTTSLDSASSSSQLGLSVTLRREVILHARKTTPMWFAKVTVDGEFFGSGKGVTKKAAKNEAAKMGLEKLGIQV
ncbi:ribonuclease III [Dendrothele bispora CBS 962.96]|uniref:Ribonuclease III n=1 Tax=Dendrothele bispora (strain CBS 962.96) TaxID=1314807 RepID=A0A4S8MY47_DENBC|nr:ribonuclease III [Dendrothele bispora CBS 962.96]